MDFFPQHSVSSDVKLRRMPLSHWPQFFSSQMSKKMSISKLCTTLIATIHISEKQTFLNIPDHTASKNSTNRSPVPCYVTKGRKLPNEPTKTHHLLRTCSSFKACGFFIPHVSNGFLLLHYGKACSKALAGKGVHSLSVGHGTYQV